MHYDMFWHKGSGLTFKNWYFEENNSYFLRGTKPESLKHHWKIFSPCYRRVVWRLAVIWTTSALRPGPRWAASTAVTPAGSVTTNLYTSPRARGYQPPSNRLPTSESLDGYIFYSWFAHNLTTDVQYCGFFKLRHLFWNHPQNIYLYILLLYFVIFVCVW